jgi:hypothetical protein
METSWNNAVKTAGKARHAKKARPALERNLRIVQAYCNVNLLLRQIGGVLTVAGTVAVLGVLIERFTSVRIWYYPIIISLGAAGILAVILLWLRQRPTSMQIALLIDERLRLHERFSTAVALADSADPFARAALAEAHAAAGRIDPRRHFLIRPSRCWFYAVSVWLLAGLLILTLPQRDLLGLLAKHRIQQEQTQEVQQTKTEINQTTRAVQLAVKQLGDAGLAEDLSGLEKMSADAKPESLRREAIRKLDDLAEKVKKLQAEAPLNSLPAMQQMFKQLRGSPDAISQQTRLAMAQGNFSRASDLIEQLQKQLSQGQLSEKERQDTARQLQELGKQLQALAQRDDQLHKELEKLGLSKELAKLSEKDLRQALQKQGLQQEQIEKLLEKARACRLAQSRCANLGKAMGACGGENDLSGEDLAALSEQLSEMESLHQQFKLSQQALAEIEQAVGCLGQCQGTCDGQGKQGPWAAGSSDRSGPGTGGPGKGYGNRATNESGQTTSEKTRAEGQAGPGQVIASWYFKDTQIKGEARRDFSTVVQAARDGAAEAISENQIPRRYEDAVKKYFGQLDQPEKK